LISQRRAEIRKGGQNRSHAGDAWARRRNGFARAPAMRRALPILRPEMDF
jgi:hypothetical protein